MQSRRLCLIIAMLFATDPFASAQDYPAGPVYVENATGVEVVVKDLQYVDARGQTRPVAGKWTLEPGWKGRFMDGGKRIVAKKVTYSMATADGTTKNWSVRSQPLDDDGDFYFGLTLHDLAVHCKVLGKADKAERIARQDIGEAETNVSVRRNQLAVAEAAVIAWEQVYSDKPSFTAGVALAAAKRLFGEAKDNLRRAESKLSAKQKSYERLLP
ncbi:MAG: hypothetical protein LC104_17770 [Bacteroidales bacterium]|nr:hypothetical protein [Bacteroidales bacterium]